MFSPGWTPCSIEATGLLGLATVYVRKTYPTPGEGRAVDHGRQTLLSNGLVYAMGIDPGGTTGGAVIGVPERSIYRDQPGRISYFETWSFTGSYSAQALELMRIASGFFPLAIALESFDPRKPIRSEEYISPILVGARIQFCIDTHYIIAPLFYQTPEQAMTTATDYRLKAWSLYKPGPDHIKDATRHAITFIRRAKSDRKLRERAWGPEPSHSIREHNGQVGHAKAVAHRRSQPVRGRDTTRRR